MKEDIREHTDYELVSEEVWELMHSWYSGGPPIFQFFSIILLFVHYFLENYTREPPIPQGGGIKTRLCEAEGALFFFQ